MRCTQPNGRRTRNAKWRYRFTSAGMADGQVRGIRDSEHDVPGSGAVSEETVTKEEVEERLYDRVTAWLRVALDDHNCHCGKCLRDYAREISELVDDYHRVISVMGEKHGK